MPVNDYNNLDENIIFAMFDEDTKTHKGEEFEFHSFSSFTQPDFQEDDEIGKHLYIPDKSYLKLEHPDFAVGNGDLTLDYWGYYIDDYCSVGTYTIASVFGVAISLFTGNLCAAFGTSSQHAYILIELRPQKWAHYAVVRKDGVAYTFVDGKLISKANAVFDLQSKVMTVNAAPSNQPSYSCKSANRYKALRMCNFARWTEDFNPPIPDNFGNIKQYELIQRYHDENGNELKKDVIKLVNEGADFTALAPAISNYKVVGYKVDDGTLISGTSVKLLAVHANHTITFVYKKSDGSGGNEENGNCGCCCVPNIILNTDAVHIDTINVHYSCCCNTSEKCCK